MAYITVIARSTTGSDISIKDFGGIVVQIINTTLSDSTDPDNSPLTIEEIRNSAEFDNHIVSGDIIINDGLGDLSSTQANNYLTAQAVGSDTDPNKDIALNTGHRLSTSNPHSVTKSQIGLGSVPDRDTANDVVGPASATDNAIARYDGATGKIIQNSGVTISGANIISGVTDPTGDQDAATKKYVDDNTIFGTQYQFTSTQEGSAFTSTTSTTPTQILKLTTPSVQAGDYRINWYYEWALSSQSADFRARVQIDDTTTIMEHSQEPKDPGTDQGIVLSGFYYATLTAAAHEIDIDYWAETGTAYIRRVRIEIWRVL